MKNVGGIYRESMYLFYGITKNCIVFKSNDVLHLDCGSLCKFSIFINMKKSNLLT